MTSSDGISEPPAGKRKKVDYPAGILKKNERMAITMTEEIEEVEALEAEQSDDALEKRMKKLESEAARILKASSELLQKLNKETIKQEDTQPENSEAKNAEELKKSE